MIIAKPFREGAEEWIRQLEEDDPLTIRARRMAGYVRNHLLPHLADRLICNLRELDLHRLSMALALTSVSTNLAGSVFNTLRRFLDYAESQHWIEADLNPATAKIALVELTSRRRARPAPRMLWLAMPSRPALSVMIEKSEGMARTAFHLLIFGGLRGNEARAFKCGKFEWDPDPANASRRRLNVDEAFCSQHLDPFVLKLPKTSSGERFVPAGKELADVLSGATIGRAADEYVLHRDGRPLTHTELNELVREEQVRLGIGRRIARPGGGHSYPGTYGVRHLRHAFVALLIFDGYQDRAISEVAGHSSVHVTLNIYGYLFQLKELGWETWPSDVVPDDLDCEFEPLDRLLEDFAYDPA